MAERSEHGESEADMINPDLLVRAAVELEGSAEDLEHMAQELRERTERAASLEQILNGLLDCMLRGVVVIGPDGRVVAVSRKAAAQYPSLEDALGKSSSTALPPELQQMLSDMDVEPLPESPWGQVLEDRVVRLQNGAVLMLFSIDKRS